MLAGRVSGVITRMPLPGDVINRGQPVYRVDNQPVVLMYGDVAAYRMLDPGVTGPDVRQLEENLTVLGYGGFTLDDTYSATTAAAVRALAAGPQSRPDRTRSNWGGFCSPRPRSAWTRRPSVVQPSTGGGREEFCGTPGRGVLVTVLLPVASNCLRGQGRRGRNPVAGRPDTGRDGWTRPTP